MKRRVGLLMLGLLFCMMTYQIYPHAGEDHGGESLSAASGPMLGAPLTVPIETQILSDIETTLVQRLKVPRSARFLGHTLIRPEYEAVVTSPQDGRLIATEDFTSPELGTSVTKGQVIAMIEEAIPASDAINISTERARVASELRQAQADLLLATSDYQRAEAVKDVIAAREVTHAQSVLTVAREKRDGLQREMAIIDSSSTNTTLGRSTATRRRVIVSPINGIIAQTHTTVGENVGRDKPLFQIVDLSELLVEADVFENDLAAVSNAISARVVVEAYPNEAFPARLVSRGTSVDEQSRALQVLFAVQNPKGKLVAGMFANVFIETGEMVDGLAIPKGAVVNQDGQSVVYVKTSGEEFVARPIVTAEKYENMAIISLQNNPAIKEGDRVVVQGMYQVRMSASKISQPVATGVAAHK